VRVWLTRNIAAVSRVISDDPSRSDHGARRACCEGGGQTVLISSSWISCDRSSMSQQPVIPFRHAARCLSSWHCMTKSCQRSLPKSQQLLGTFHMPTACGQRLPQGERDSSVFNIFIAMLICFVELRAIATIVHSRLSCMCIVQFSYCMTPTKFSRK